MLLLKQSVFAYERMFSSLPQIKDKAGDIFLEPVEVYEKTVCEAEAAHLKISASKLNNIRAKRNIRYEKSKTHPPHPKSLDFEVKS